MGIVKRGNNYCIRYYGPDGRQRWETIGPNRKEAETVLHQRMYESRLGIYPILRRRHRMTFGAFVKEWETKRLIRPRASTKGTYRSLLEHHLLPEFGDSVLSDITMERAETWVAKAAGRYKPKYVNHQIALLKQLLAAAADWDYLPASPIAKLRKFKVSRRDMVLWTQGELRRFLLTAPEAWQPVWLVAVFAGLRPEELQAMSWTERNWPDFTANVIHVNCGYEAKSKVLGAPKTDESVRDVDMVPAVRRALEALPSRAAGGVVFPRADGRMFSRDAHDRAWHRTIKATKVRPIRPYDLRHTYASLLIAAGKNPLYVSDQMGHHSAGFTFDTHGHLMESLPKRQVEWIDELVFPGGFETALKLHLSDVLSGAPPCSSVLSSQAPEPRADATSATSCNPEESRAWWGGKDSNLRRHSAS